MPTRTPIAPKAIPPDQPTPWYRAIRAEARIGPAVMSTGISKINPSVTRLDGGIVFAAENSRREIIARDPDGCVTVAISALSVT